MTEPLTPSERELQRVYNETLRLPREAFLREADRVKHHGGTLGALTHEQSLGVIDAGENLWRSLNARPRTRRNRVVTIVGIALAAALGITAAALLAIHTPL